jgi:hypothetical protein
VSYNSQEIKALAAPFWGVDMDELAGVAVVGFTKDGRVLFIDSSQGLQEPGGPGVPAATSTRDQATKVAMRLLYAAHNIIGGCVLGRE